jgi:hypothetical protein
MIAVEPRHKMESMMSQKSFNEVTHILVPHTAFAQATSLIESCFQLMADSSEPVCIALIGESRTGKSRVLETCCLNHPSKRLVDGLIVPILRVKAQSKPTVKGLAELMLSSLGAPDSYRGTENQKTERLSLLIDPALLERYAAA